jgi:hypothetical protein
LCNDSVFVLPDRLSAFLTRVLAQREEWIGTTENTEPSPHVQSWFFCVGRTVWDNAAFKSFWRRYLPLDARMHAVKQGEAGLSKLLLQQRFWPVVHYSSVHFMGDVWLKQADPAVYFPRLFLASIKKRDWRDWLKLYQKRASGIHFWQIWGVLRDDLPFIKKDIRYRVVFDEKPLREFFGELPQRGYGENAKEIENAIMARSADALSPWQKFLWRMGII